MKGCIRTIGCAWLVALLCILTQGTSSAAAQQDGKCYFRMLAVGDSITEGVVPSKGVNHPYTIQLKSLLQQKLPCCTIAIDNGGVGGAGIFAVGTERQTTLVPFEANLLKTASTKNQPYDLVMIAGGINDLLKLGKPADQIAPGFYKLYNEALATGANVLVLPPFPSTLISQGDQKNKERQKLGQLQTAFANGKSKVEVLNLADSGFNFYAQSASEQSKLLDDGLHLTVAGYDLMGKTIFNFINTKMSNILPSCSNSGK